MSWTHTKSGIAGDIVKYVNERTPKADGIQCILQGGKTFHCWVRQNDKGNKWEMQNILYNDFADKSEIRDLFFCLMENELVVPIQFNIEASPRIWYFRKKIDAWSWEYDKNREVLEEKINKAKPKINKMHVLLHKGGTFHSFFQPDPKSSNRYDLKAEINEEDDQIENITNLLNTNQGLPIEFDYNYLDGSRLWVVVKKP